MPRKKKSEELMEKYLRTMPGLSFDEFSEMMDKERKKKSRE